MNYQLSTFNYQLKVCYEQAMEKAEKEYAIFRQKQLANHKSDFDIFWEQVKKIDG